MNNTESQPETVGFPALEVLSAYSGISCGGGMPQKLVGHLIGDHHIMTIGTAMVIGSKLLRPGMEKAVPQLKNIEEYDSEKFKNDPSYFDEWKDRCLEILGTDELYFKFGCAPVTPDELIAHTKNLRGKND